MEQERIAQRRVPVGLGAILLLLLCSCGPVKEPEMVRGGLYTVKDGEGSFRPAKILAFDTAVVHLRLYSNRLEGGTDTMIIDTLRLSPLPGESPARDFFPVSRTLFLFWRPELVGFDSVSVEEAEMVREWEISDRERVGVAE